MPLQKVCKPEDKEHQENAERKEVTGNQELLIPKDYICIYIFQNYEAECKVKNYTTFSRVKNYTT